MYYRMLLLLHARQCSLPDEFMELGCPWRKDRVLLIVNLWQSTYLDESMDLSPSVNYYMLGSLPTLTNL